MAKRPNGTGSIEQLKNGRWRVRITVDGRRRTLGTYDTEAEARTMLKAFRRQVAKEAIVAPGSVTLRTFADEWLTRREVVGSAVRREVKSAHDERLAWERHGLAHPIAEMAVQSIRRRDVEDFATWLRTREAVDAIRTRDGIVRRPTGRTIGEQRQRHVMRLLRQCLDEAVRIELIDRNPAAKVRVARQAGARKLDDDWLRAHEIGALLSCDAIGIRDRTAYACAIGLALRLNDLKALRVADVHLDAEVPGPHVVVRIGKRDDEIHRVPVMPWLDPWIRAHLEALPDGAVWLFGRADGERYASKEYDFRWAEKRQRNEDGEIEVVHESALRLAGIGRRIRFHDLRGTCATHLAIGTWGRRWSLHEIQRMLTHADQRTTERYVRRALDMLADAAAQTGGGPGGPKSAGQPSSTVAHADREKLSTPGQIRTADLQLRKSPPESTIPGAYGGGSPRVGNAAAEAARAVIGAVREGGAIPRGMLHELADAVLDDPAVRLALEVRAGGPHAVARAIDLAELVLGGADATAAVPRR